MEACTEVLTFESVDENLKSDHSNVTSLSVLLHGFICCFFFSKFYQIKFEFFFFEF